MAKKQSLVGVCFAGVQKLVNQHLEPPEMLYLTLMGMAAKIQQRNEVVNRQCVELQQLLLKDGLQTSVLKGQGVGAIYKSVVTDVPGVSKVSDLSMLRQSGDIDLWIQGGMQKAYDYCKDKFGAFDYDYINAYAPFYEDTEVELHWRVHSLPNPFANKRLQRWFDEHEDDLLSGKTELQGSGSITVLSNEFNAFFILLHCYHHMFESGLGLRKLMDWYFVLKSRNNDNANHNDNFISLIKQFGMMRFTKGVMWIKKTVFAGHDNDNVNDNFFLQIEPDEMEGRYILE